MRPERSSILRSHLPASAESWVTTIKVAPRSRFKAKMRSMMPAPVASSRFQSTRRRRGWPGSAPRRGQAPRAAVRRPTVFAEANAESVFEADGSRARRWPARESHATSPSQFERDNDHFRKPVMVGMRVKRLEHNADPRAAKARQRVLAKAIEASTSTLTEPASRPRAMADP